MKKLFLAILILMPFSVLAGNKWTGYKKVIQVQGLQEGGFIVYLDSEISSDCTNAGTNSLYVRSGFGGVDDKGIQSLLSITLTAFTTGYEVSIMYEDTVSTCDGKYILIRK